MLSVYEIKLDSFEVKPHVEKETLVLKWVGTGDMLTVEPLKACLRHVSVAMKAGTFAGLKIDIQALYLLNSSCIKTLVQFIYLNIEGNLNFPIEFLVDSKLSWQPRALAALKRLAPHVVTITSSSS